MVQHGLMWVVVAASGIAVISAVVAVVARRWFVVAAEASFLAGCAALYLGWIRDGEMRPAILLLTAPAHAGWFAFRHLDRRGRRRPAEMR